MLENQRIPLLSIWFCLTFFVLNHNKKATMKNPSFILLVFALSIATMFTTSCKKKGCADSEAINYSEEAEKDDGSCSYEGTIVFWYGEATAAGLVSDGAITMTYYVDGENIGSSDADIFWTGAPECGQDGSVGVVENWKNDRTRTYSTSVVDQNGWEHWAGPVTFEANTCGKIQLMWSKRKKK
jgi:hypothetical protein